MPWYAQLQIFKKLEIRHFGNKPFNCVKNKPLAYFMLRYRMLGATFAFTPSFSPKSNEDYHCLFHFI